MASNSLPSTSGINKYLALLVSLALTACGGGREESMPASSTFKITSATATSSQYVDIAIQGTPSAEQKHVDNYRIVDDQGAILEINALSFSLEKELLLLQTDQQLPIDYRLYTRSTSEQTTGGGPATKVHLKTSTLTDDWTLAVNFTGTDLGEPYVQTAMSLDNTHVLLVFSEKMSESVVDVSNYAVGENALQIISADQDSDNNKRTVILQTSSQANQLYEIKVANVVSSTSSGIYIDPTRNRISFQGIFPNESTAPALISAQSSSSTSVLLSFSEPLQGSAENIANFAISPGLNITGAKLSSYNNDILLTTSTQTPGTTYTVYVSDVSDKSNNTISSVNNWATFGTDIDSTGPQLVAANSINNTQVLLYFNEQLNANVANASIFSAMAVNDNAKLLVIERAEILHDSSRVLLTTAPQEQGIKYTVSVSTQARDVAGNAMDASANTAEFGTGLNDTSPPVVNSVAATSSSSIKISFNEALAENAGKVENFIVSDGIKVNEVVFASDRKTINLFVSALEIGKSYILEIVGLTDIAGNQIASNSNIFGAGLNDATSPVITRVVSLDEKSLRVEFSEPLREEGFKAANFLISYGEHCSDKAYEHTLSTGVTACLVSVSTTTCPPVTSLTLSDGSQVCLGYVAPVNGQCEDSSLEITNSANETQFCFKTRSSNRSYLQVVDVEINEFGTSAIVTTEPQAAGVKYELQVVNVADKSNNVIALADSTEAFQLNTNVLTSTAANPELVGAVALSNNKIRLNYNKAMGDSAISTNNYVIVADSNYLQEDASNAQYGTLYIVDAQFAQISPDKVDRSVVILQTLAQSQIRYRLNAVGVKDISGNPILTHSDVIALPYNAAEAIFVGLAPTADSLLDYDHDGLTDAEEQRGWSVSATTVSGRVTWGVTSDPFLADTDGDGLADVDEKRFRIDPRDRDTDDDGLSDNQELNEIYSAPDKQDTDGDGYDDGLEFSFFKTSPILDDTDGDQISDDVEIETANRNPRNADVPLINIEVGDVGMNLNVIYTATSTEGSRQLDAQEYTSTLAQSDSSAYSSSDSSTNQFNASVSATQGWGMDGTLGFTAVFEESVSYGGEWTSSYTSESVSEAQQVYEDSLSTEAETTAEEAVTRELESGSMRVPITLKHDGNLAYNISDIQVSVFTQDTSNPGKLIPVGTLLPEAVEGADNSYSLGPLMPEKGPIIFYSDNIYPSVIESLMISPQNLVFKIADFSITDELGREFSFTSQDINDRTASLVIDYGGLDADKDGYGDNADRYFVSTSAGRIVDLDGDGTPDHRVVFDWSGKQVGITVKSALTEVLGLQHYNENIVPTSSLSTTEVYNSFSTKTISGIQYLWRVKGVSRELNSSLKRWEILTPTGIDRSTNFNDLILKPESGVTLAFVQDLDHDGIPASWESLNGCSDDPSSINGGRDSDDDGLEDRFELFGPLRDQDGNIVLTPAQPDEWVVDVENSGAYPVYSSCGRADTDSDGLTDKQEYNFFRMVNGVKTRTSLDPNKQDTDGDGLTDWEEVNGVSITLNFPYDPSNSHCQLTASNGGVDTVLCKFVQNSGSGLDPLNPDSDGDGVEDGLEVQLGLDPTVDDADYAGDNDQDGLLNFVEVQGYNWPAGFQHVSTVEGVDGVTGCNSVGSTANECAPDSGITDYWSNPDARDTDGDSLDDPHEYALQTNPGKRDTDNDGLMDNEEVEVLANADGSFTYNLIYNPLDADIDNDTLSDGTEVNQPITVARYVKGISGALQFVSEQVNSSPFDIDADGDGLTDSQERSYGTHPGDDSGKGSANPGWDTDQDGYDDGKEITLGLDPLYPDQRLGVLTSEIVVTSSKCDNGSVAPALHGDFDWSVEINKNTSTVYSKGQSEDNNKDVGAVLYSESNYTDFNFKSGDTLSVNISVVERDVAPNDDDVLVLQGNTQTTYTYPITLNNVTYSYKFTGNNNDCSVDVKLLFKHY